jgi:hypothetical protein
MVQPTATVITAVEPHLPRAAWIGTIEGADLDEAQLLGPEAVRFLDIPDIDHKVIQAGRRDRAVLGVAHDGRSLFWRSFRGFQFAPFHGGLPTAE